MRGGHAKARSSDDLIMACLRHCAADQLSIGLLIGGISVLVVTSPPIYAWLWLIVIALLMAWRLRHRKKHDPRHLHEDQALLEIASKAAKLGGWVVHLPDRRLEWSDETWAIHEIPRGKTVTLEEGIGYFAPE